MLNLWCYFLFLTYNKLVQCLDDPLPNGYYNFVIDHFTISIGEPPQFDNLDFTFDYATSDVIVYDAECGEDLTTCKKYCRDEKFRKMFCLPLCEELSEMASNIFCPRKFVDPIDKVLGSPLHYSPVYYGNRSKTLKNTDEYQTWVDYAFPAKKFIGQKAFEEFKIYGDEFVSKDKILINAKMIKFIRAKMVHPTKFFNHSLSIGIAMGPNNFFVQLHEQKLIDKAQISTFPTIAGFQNVTVGGIDNNTCQPWIFQPAISDRLWIINIKTLNIMGVKFDNVQARVDEDSINFVFGVLLPYKIRKELMEREILYLDRHVSPILYLIRCNQTITMKFELDDGIYEFDNRFLIANCFNSTFAYSWFSTPVVERRYIGENTMVLGQQFMQSYCFSFDYTTKKFGLARNSIPLVVRPSDDCMELSCYF